MTSRTEADDGGGSTSTPKHGSQPHGRAWGLKWAASVQEIVPVDQTISIFTLEFLCYRFLAFLVTDEMI